jgi:hypothetical protein
MGRYPEAEDRDSTVVNLETYRQRRATIRQDSTAGQKPRDEGNDGAGPDDAPVEGNRKD